MFNRGEKIVCVNNVSEPDDSDEYRLNLLTIGKIYSVKEIKNFIDKERINHRRVILDETNNNYWYEWRFVSLKEYRKEKLEKLNTI